MCQRLSCILSLDDHAAAVLPSLPGAGLWLPQPGLGIRRWALGNFWLMSFCELPEEVWLTTT